MEDRLLRFQHWLPVHKCCSIFYSRMDKAGLLRMVRDVVHQSNLKKETGSQFLYFAFERADIEPPTKSLLRYDYKPYRNGKRTPRPTNILAQGMVPVDVVELERFLKEHTPPVPPIARFIAKRVNDIGFGMYYLININLDQDFNFFLIYRPTFACPWG